MTTTKKTTHRAPATNGDIPDITQEQLAAFQRKQEEQKRLRVQSCAQEVAAVCAKFDCDLVGVPQLRDAGGVFVIAVGVQIIPK
jgi:hypothetical protein